MKKAFVIMSFKPEHEIVYLKAIKPALEARGLTCIRSDEEHGPANIIGQVVKEIIDADVVIADISDPSPNVFYELGISHSVGNKTIAITSDITGLPFDIRAFRAISYSKDDSGLRLLKAEIEGEVKSLLKQQQYLPNNPVQEAGKDYFDLRKQIEQSLKDLREERLRTEAYTEFHMKKKKGQDQDNRAVAAEIMAEIAYHFVPKSGRSLLVSICGAGAVGKSTFADLLKKEIENWKAGKISVDILPTDSYLRRRADRISQNVLGYRPETHQLDKMCTDLEQLFLGKPVNVTPYDHKTGDYSEERIVHPSDILIIEGVYSFYPSIIPLNKSLKYFIYATKNQAKELKFIADILERQYDIQTAFLNADELYESYETYILPYLKLADFVIPIDNYWKFGKPAPRKHLI